MRVDLAGLLAAGRHPHAPPSPRGLIWLGVNPGPGAAVAIAGETRVVIPRPAATALVARIDTACRRVLKCIAIPSVDDIGGPCLKLRRQLSGEFFQRWHCVSGRSDELTVAAGCAYIAQ